MLQTKDWKAGSDGRVCKALLSKLYANWTPISVEGTSMHNNSLDWLGVGWQVWMELVN